MKNSELQQVKFVSDQYQKFSVWDLKNHPISINSKQCRLKKYATIKKRPEGNYIEKTNQQYKLIVSYNFTGPESLEKKAQEDNIEKFKPKIAIGYKVYKEQYKWRVKDSTQYYYIFIVIFIIFLICAILLESLKQPVAVIFMIPISFIGVFFTFYLFDFGFDQGDYASFVLLCGISVNSSLYIINDFNNLKKQFPKINPNKLYFKAFNNKITPILLTIISTVVGLLPFVLIAKEKFFGFLSQWVL